MSFAGFNVDKLITDSMTFEQIVNLSSSFQKSVFTHLSKSVQRALDHLILRKNVPVTAISICGGVSSNKQLYHQIQSIASIFGNIPVFRSEP